MSTVARPAPVTPETLIKDLPAKGRTKQDLRLVGLPSHEDLRLAVECEERNPNAYVQTDADPCAKQRNAKAVGAGVAEMTGYAPAWNWVGGATLLGAVGAASFFALRFRAARRAPPEAPGSDDEMGGRVPA